jgi:hypothetical protein
MRLRAFIAAALLAGAAWPARMTAEPKPLTIVKPVLHQYENGPAVGAGYSFFTGDTVFFSFQIGGYKVSPDSKIDLSYRIEAADADGVPIVEPIQGSVATEVSEEDKHWMPVVRSSVLMPPLGLGGVYHIKIAAEDKLSHQKAAAGIDVPVRGRHVEPSPVLTARNFRFQRTEEDSDALVEAIYHPGDTVWAHFEITGFRYAEKNHIHVEYGVELLDAAGKSLFSLPQAAVEDDQSFYPKRYLPGMLSLNLAKDILPGQYAVVVTLRDGVGNQNQELRETFRVE